MTAISAHWNWHATTASSDKNGDAENYVLTNDAAALEDLETEGVRVRRLGGLAQRTKVAGNRLIAILARCAPAREMTLVSVSDATETSGSRLRPDARRAEAEWELLNDRRGELLVKRLSDHLSEPEARELGRLDAIAEVRIGAMAQRAYSRLATFPSPPADLDQIVEPPTQ